MISNFKSENSNLKFRRCRLWEMTMVISCLLSLLFVCLPVCAADMNMRIQAPDTELMMPPASPPLIRQEGLPLSWESAYVKEFIGFIEKGAYKEALAYFREQEGSAEDGSFLDMIEEGDSDGRLKRKTTTGGTEQGDTAGSFLQDFNKRGRISTYMLYLLGHTYFALEKYPAAETAFLAALVSMPDFIRVHESLGFLYLRMGRFEDAQKHLANIAGLGIHTAELHGAMGYLHYKTENFWGAAEAFRKALMLERNNERWKRELLQALSRTYQYQETLVLAKRMLLKQPDDAGLWLFRAKAALQAGEREEALSSLETAIRLGDDNHSNLEACAALHLELGSIERALALMKSGFPEEMDFGRIDEGMERMMQAEAWDALQRMLGSVRNRWDGLDGPQRSKVLSREADISLHLNDRTTAGNALKKAIAIDPSNAHALISLADIHRAKGNYDRAELLYQRAGAYRLHRERALISLAQLALDRDDFEGALRTLSDMLEEFPNRADLKRSIESLGNLVLLEEQ